MGFAAQGNAAAAPAHAPGSVPLCVDLDGTLCRTDTALEMLLVLLRRQPWLALTMPLWLLRGRAAFKERLARLCTLDPSGLCYNQRLLELIREERGAGRPVVLVTAANERVAHMIAGHLGLFDAVIASTGVVQMKGRRKAIALRERFGPRGFDYAGDSRADLQVWAEARTAIFAGRSRQLQQQLERAAGNIRIVTEAPACDWRQVLRVHQWAKNLIIFIPLAAAHQFRNVPAIGADCAMFAAFCLCASSAYIFNDLLDLAADRRHADKRNRPFAAGALRLQTGLVLAPALALAGLALALAISIPAFTVAAVYLAITVAYSLVLKRLALLDIFVLAGLYSIRLISGHIAAHIQFSVWLLAFSGFIFLSLATVKRVSELHGRPSGQELAGNGRGYLPGDLELLQPLGIVSGGLSVLVLALYVNSVDVIRLYRHPLLLLGLCPIFFYWIVRVWLIAQRGEMHSDPVLFALKDKLSYGLLLAVAGVFLVAGPR